MTPELFERLLHLEESESLDFKAGQYPSLSGPEDSKRELLKDALAFANSWRTGDGHILIGVSKKQGHRGEVVGVSEHFDDADLQQFVNGKTNRAVRFTYEAFPYEGKQVGVLTFKEQNRPVCLKNDFAKLRKNIVYVRQSSSTIEADPDEIAKMAMSGIESDKPVLDLQFGYRKSRQPLGQSITLTSTTRKLLPRGTAKSESPVSGLLGLATYDITRSAYHPDEMQVYLFMESLLQPFCFCVTNRSHKVANGVRLEARIPTNDGLWLKDEKPKKPGKVLWDVPLVQRSSFNFHVNKNETEYLVSAGFGKIQPGAIGFCELGYIGSTSKQSIAIPATLYCDELPSQQVDLMIGIEVVAGRPVDITEL